MKTLQTELAALPTLSRDGRSYLSYRAVTDRVAAFLFPDTAPDRMDAADYRRVLETADTLCREPGYTDVVKLVPPDVQFADMGLYWTALSHPVSEPDPVVIHTGPDRAELLRDEWLLDVAHPSGAWLRQLGLDEVTRQHFKIPVTASESVMDLMRRAVAAAWPNDYKGIWHDILGMCVTGGRDINATERLFTVIIRGLRRRRYWHFKAQIKVDGRGSPILHISLVDEANAGEASLFPLGHVVMTPGAAALDVDFTPYLARHVHGDWGELDAFDRRQNGLAVKEGYRILSAYDVPVVDGETVRIWIITEADRLATTILLPEEY